MATKAVALAANYSNATPADGAAFGWSGGRGVIMADATAFPTTCQVQMQSLNGSWVNIGSNLTAASISSELALPAGQYRLHMTGGTATAVSVSLVSIPYI